VRSSGLLIGVGVTAAGEAAAVSQRGEGKFVDEVAGLGPGEPGTPVSRERGELGSDAGAAAEELVERGEERPAPPLR
jgi:hypothetical protein